MLVSYTVYKNEFCPTFVEYLLKKFEDNISYESDTRFTLEGIDEKVVELIANEMYVSSENISGVWEDYKCIKEEVIDVLQEMRKIHDEYQNLLIKFCTSPAYKNENVPDEYKEKIDYIYQLEVMMRKVREF